MINDFINKMINVAGFFILCFCSTSIQASLFSESFDNFTGAGFVTSPTDGQLDSNRWLIKGLSEGDTAWGNDYNSGDFARGESTGGESTGGVYAFQVGGGNVIMGIQATGTDFAPGEIIVKLENTLGITLTDLTISYDFWYYNNENRASALAFSWSLDNNTYTPIPYLPTPAAKASSPSWQVTPYSTTLTELNFGDSEFLYLRWQGYDAGGSGARDEIGIDNILVKVPVVAIHQIQGDETTSPLLDQVVTIEGIVVGDFQGNDGLNGFFVQAEESQADDNPATSEGIFVYEGYTSSVEVRVGDKVQVIGKVFEYNKLTEITDVSRVTVLSSNNQLPAVTIIDDLVAANTSSLERFEGMRVQFSQPLYLTEYYQLARYGTVMLSVEGRLEQFTHRHAPSRSGYENHQTEIAQRRLLLDDGSNQENPTTLIFARGGHPLSTSNLLRGGDTITKLTGILDYRYGNYRVQNNTGVNFSVGNPRPTIPPAVGGKLKVASFNVMNYFTTFNQRGADNHNEWVRQQNKLIAALIAMNADIVGLIEIENNGYEENSAIASLVKALNNQLGSKTYDFVDPELPRLGGDAIAVALIYKPSTVTLRGTAQTKTDGAFAMYNRPPLVQTFTETASGETLTVVVNHFKSKGSVAKYPEDADQKDGQGMSNYTRTQAAQALAAWLATDPTASGDNDFLIIGDINAYAQEAPMTELENAGYTNLFEQNSETYSYVYDGQVGYLDHALASADLAAQVTGVAHWSINADEPSAFDYNDDNPANLYTPTPFRSSDHDPVLIGLQLKSQSINSQNSKNNHSQTSASSPLPPILSLHIKTAGTGNGTVTSVPHGIHCHTGDDSSKQNDSCRHDYKTGTTVALIPLANDDSQFIGWSGKGCQKSQVWMTRHRYCTAYFKQLPSPITTSPSSVQSTTDTDIYLEKYEPTACPINFSCRAQLQGAHLISGFTIVGTDQKKRKVLIRGIGLETGIDPMITVQHSPSGENMASNDNWSSSLQLPETQSYLTDLQANDAGLLLELPPGTYTIIMTSHNQAEAGEGLLSIDFFE
jgi:predicted extracellular nuclease